MLYFCLYSYVYIMVELYIFKAVLLSNQSISILNIPTYFCAILYTKYFVTYTLYETVFYDKR